MKTAIVGCGNVFNLAYLPIIRKIKGIELKATCDIEVEKAKNASAKLGIDKFYPDMQSMLKSEKLDLIILCTPTYTHHKLSILGLKNGAHVICEKPIAVNSDQAKKMIEASDKTGKKLFIAQARRFDPRWTGIKADIDSKSVGEVVFLRRSEQAGASFPRGSWYVDPKKGGGVLLDVGIHCSDFINWYVGEGKFPATIKATGLTGSDAGGGEDCIIFASVFLEYENGKSGLFEVSWMHPRAHGPFYSDLTIWGTNGKIEYEDKNSNPMLTVQEEKTEFPRYYPMMSAPPVTFQIEVQHFVDCIRYNREPRVTSAEALLALEIIEEARSCIELRKTSHSIFSK